MNFPLRLLTSVLTEMASIQSVEKWFTKKRLIVRCLLTLFYW